MPRRPDAEKVSFSRQIAPVLIKNCLGCHGARIPRATISSSAMRKLKGGGYSGSPILTPGKPEESELYNLIASDDADVRMPKEGDALSADRWRWSNGGSKRGPRTTGADPQASLASIAPKNAYPAALLSIAAAADHGPGLSSCGEELAASGYHEVTIWNPGDGKLLRRIGDVAQRIYGLQYSPDGTLLAVASGTPGLDRRGEAVQSGHGQHGKGPGDSGDVRFTSPSAPTARSWRPAAATARSASSTWPPASRSADRGPRRLGDGRRWSPDGTRTRLGQPRQDLETLRRQDGRIAVHVSGPRRSVLRRGFRRRREAGLVGRRDRKIRSGTRPSSAKNAEIGGFGHEVYAHRAAGAICCSAARPTRRSVSTSSTTAPRSESSRAMPTGSIA